MNLAKTAGLLLAMLLSPGQEGKRIPVPNAAEQKQAENLIREIFGEEYRSKTASVRRTLAAKLLQQARETPEPPALYVLLREAADLAAETGDAAVALDAAAEIGRKFETNARDVTRSALDKLRKSAGTPEAWTPLAEAYLALSAEALSADDFDAALATAKEAEAAAVKAKQLPIVGRTRARVAEVAEMKQRHGAVAEARKKLAVEPDHPESCTRVGQYLCLVQNNWGEGLPLLAKGQEPALKALAAADLALPAAPKDQVAVADGWWDLAEKTFSPRDRKSLQLRAAFWYEQAIPGLTGLHRTKAEQRVKAGVPVRTERRVDLLAQIDPARDGVAGTWRKEKGVLISPRGGAEVIRLPHRASGEYDLALTVERKEGDNYLIIGLTSAGLKASVVLDSWPQDGGIFGLQRVDGNPVKTNPTAQKGQWLKPGKPATVVCSVRKSGITVAVDGSKVLAWTEGWSRLSAQSPAASGLGLFLETCVSVFHFSKIGIADLGDPPPAEAAGAVARQVTFEIAAEKDWQEGCPIKPGERITIEASGQWRYATGEAPFIGPNGSGAQIEGLPLHALIARSGGKTFAVGAKWTGVVEGPKLEFKMHDRYMPDNNGSLTVKVTRGP